MQEILPQKLKELAYSCDFPLYVVGGTCREYLSSSFPLKADYDICAPVVPEVFAEAAEKLGFESTAVYKNTGTVKMKAEGQDYEFTSFRSDKYVRGMPHARKNLFHRRHQSRRPPQGLHLQCRLLRHKKRRVC